MFIDPVELPSKISNTDADLLHAAHRAATLLERIHQSIFACESDQENPISVKQEFREFLMIEASLGSENVQLLIERFKELLLTIEAMDPR